MGFEATIAEFERAKTVDWPRFQRCQSVLCVLCVDVELGCSGSEARHSSCGRYPRGTHVGTDCHLIRHRVLSALIASLLQRVEPLGAVPCT
jgi:hypothetical protein